MSDERQKPVFSAAPEVLVGNKARLESDVWSYGVVLYEIASLGETPYDFADEISQKQMYNRDRVRLKIQQDLNEKYYEFNCISDPTWRTIVSKNLGKYGITSDEANRYFFQLMKQCFFYVHTERIR